MREGRSMAKKKQEEKIEEALLKVALGYQVKEVTEEYAEVDGAMKLTKRKQIKKDVPPDLKAVQILLANEEGGVGLESLSDEELEYERERLLAALGKAENVGDAKVKSVKKTAVKTAAAKKKTSVKKKTAK